MTKINKLPCHKKTSMNLKCMLLSGRIQYEKATYCMIPIIKHAGKKPKTVEKSKDLWLPRAQRSLKKMNEASIFSDFTGKRRCKQINRIKCVDVLNRNTGEKQLMLLWRGEATVKASI